MKKINWDSKYISLSINEKKDYIITLLNKYSLNNVIDSLVLNNNNTEENFKIIELISNSKIIKQKIKINKAKIRSILIKSYLDNNKTLELEKYLDTIDRDRLKPIINYEIKYKTEFSHLKVCNELYKSLNNVTNDKKKKLDLEYKDNINTNTNIDTNKTKKNNKKRYILFILLIILLLIGYFFVFKAYQKIGFYNKHIYPNTYLDNTLIENKSNDDIIKLLNEKDDIINQKIIFKNDNNSFEYKYIDIGYSTNKDLLMNKLINDYKNSNGYKKLFRIMFSKKEDYTFEYILDEEKYNKFLEDLKSKVNVSKTNQSFSIKDGNINYQKGLNGFVLNEENLKDKIIESIKNNTNEIILDGSIDKTDNTLGLINKKIVSFQTNFQTDLGRAKNITIAASRVNGTILYPGDTFSFYKAAGPYNGSLGYVFYYNDVGSGVCQVSTTIYNAALLLNLQIVERYNHGDMVWYVDYGLDATVYGSTTDTKFKNNTDYPIYVEATTINGILTVSLWSNENIIPEGYSYKPRVVPLGGLGYKTYLDTYYNGEFVSSKYLNSSYYTKGK